MILGQYGLVGASVRTRRMFGRRKTETDKKWDNYTHHRPCMGSITTHRHRLIRLAWAGGAERRNSEVESLS